MIRSQGVASAANVTPTMPPAPASTRLSVNNCRANCPRPAPNAIRMAISFLRPAARASNKFATFAVAISNTSPTTASNTSNAVLESPSISRASGTRSAWMVLFVAG